MIKDYAGWTLYVNSFNQMFDGLKMDKEGFPINGEVLNNPNNYAHVPVDAWTIYKTYYVPFDKKDIDNDVSEMIVGIDGTVCLLINFSFSFVNERDDMDGPTYAAEVEYISKQIMNEISDKTGLDVINVSDENDMAYSYSLVVPMNKIAKLENKYHCLKKDEQKTLYALTDVYYKKFDEYLK